MSQEAAIKAVLRDFACAYERRNLAAMRELFVHDDACIFYGTQANLHFVGWPAVEGSLVKQFAVLERVSLTYRETHIRIFAGESAACVATFVDYDATISGAPVIASGIRVTCSLDRGAAGWRIAQMHWSIARGEVIVDH